MYRPQEIMTFRIDPGTLHFDLPDDLIAQEPTVQRDQARLIVLNRKSGEIAHRIFADIIDYLQPGDVLVINRARVSKSKVEAKKVTGGRVEIVFLEKTDLPQTWKALVRPLLKEGTEILFESGARAVQAGRADEGENLLQFTMSSAEEVMNTEGRVPLPPYIKRTPSDPRKNSDEEYYQTVYASEPGSVAAPTAGLHFSEELLAKIKSKGVIIVPLLLNVGWGTFRPIVSDVASHRMLPETYLMPSATFQEIENAKREKRRVITVGTTSTRVVESVPEKATSEQLQGATNLFITPGFSFRWIDGLVTNLHVPKSTPVSLTAAFVGLPLLEKAYAQAIENRYRFFSYGDAMLVL